MNGQLIFILGMVVDSHITRRTTDKEREEANKHRALQYKHNYTAITISQPKIINAKGTMEERYVRKFLDQSDVYTVTNFTNKLPTTGIVNDDNTCRKVSLQYEPPKGMNVMITVQVSKEKNDTYQTVLRGVLITEPDRYLAYESRQRKLDTKPVKVIFNDPATIVFWADGTKTIARCDKEDTYNEETGLLIAIGKHFLGNKAFHQTMEKCLPHGK